MPPSSAKRPHALDDLAFSVSAEGEALHGNAAVSPTMWVPGTTMLSISLAATYADYTLGSLAVSALTPRMPVTLGLDVHLFADAVDLDHIQWTAAVVKAGRSVIVTNLDFTGKDGRRVGFAHGLFMASPDPRLKAPARTTILDHFAAERGVLIEPFAARVGCERRAPGTVVLPSAPHIHNASGSINGGLLTSVIEEAALSADRDSRPLESMQVRYLRGIRNGPAVARARIQSGFADVEVSDGHAGALAVLATTRSACS